MHIFFKFTLAVSMTLSVLALGTASASTATFTSDVEVLTNADLQTLNATDSDSYFIGSGDTMFIQLDEPIGTDTTNDFFTLNYEAPDNRRRSFRINFGYTDGTTFTSVFRRGQRFSTRGSGSITLFGFSNYCSVAGGCNFISLTGGRQGGGYSVDSVAVNNELVTPTGQVPSAPEPGTWVLIIMGFIGVAMRLKSIKRKGGLAPYPRAIQQPLLAYS